MGGAGRSYEEVAASLMEAARRLVELGEEPGRAGTDMLRALACRGGHAAPSELAAALGCSRARATRVLDGLEGRGLVARSVDPDDRRRVVVRLTEAGARRAREGREAATDDLARILARLGERDVGELARILGRARDAWSAGGPRAHGGAVN